MRRSGTVVDILRGCVLSERDETGERVRDIDTASEWWGIVIEGFGLAYGDLTAPERDALWRNVRAAHDAWEAAGRP